MDEEDRLSASNMSRKNIYAIHSADERDISLIMGGWGGNTSVHCTNGTYAYEAAMIVPTTLAGFKFIDDKVADLSDVFLVAVNSDVSMQNIMNQKNASAAERAALEDQHVRAAKVAIPLSEMFPHRTILVVYYDKETPTDLYGSLYVAGLNLKSLHKWGYGTDPNAPKIEGAYGFRNKIAYPLPNDVKPVCFDLTVKEDQSAIVQVVKLTEAIGPHRAPYISKQGKVLFPVPASLASHAENPASVAAAPAPKPAP